MKFGMPHDAVVLERNSDRILMMAGITTQPDKPDSNRMNRINRIDECVTGRRPTHKDILGTRHAEFHE